MYFKTIDFSKYSSIKIGPITQVAIIEDEYDFCDEFLIGAAFNLLISDTPPRLCALSDKFDFIRLENDSLFVGAATMAGQVYSFTKKYNICGFEFLFHLPGTIGGLVAMNAGMKEYEIFDVIKRVRFASGWINASEIPHSYRFTNLPGIIFEVEFYAKQGFKSELLGVFSKMRENQPKEPSAGSFFKNPPNDYAGRLIEAVGLKGHKIGNAAFSAKHANFLINIGNATFYDAISLVELAEKMIYEEFGIALEREVKVLGL